MSKPWVDGAGKVEGNCPEGSILHAKNYCKFAHPWISDSVDVLDEDNLELLYSGRAKLKEVPRSMRNSSKTLVGRRVT